MSPPPAQPGPAPRWRKWSERVFGIGVFGTLATLFVFALFWDHIVITIPPGSVGVLWLRFWGGTVTRYTYREGTALIFPWDRIYLYSTRLERLDHTTTELSNDGLAVTLSATVSFHVQGPTAGALLMEVGPDYVARLVAPMLDSAMRRVIVTNMSDKFYDLEIEARIADSMQRKIAAAAPSPAAGSSLIQVTEVSVHGVSLPQEVSDAINAKVAATQGIQRREAEATGIRSFQETVTPSISDSYLRWRAIEATLALAQSPNSKIIVMGTGGTSMPLILDGRTDVPIGPAPQAPGAVSPTRPPDLLPGPRPPVMLPVPDVLPPAAAPP